MRQATRQPARRTARRAALRRAGPSPPPTGGAPGGFGGGGGSTTVSSELIDLLNATTTRWSAAVSGAQSAAPYILDTDTAVMAIGGFSGSDP